MRMAETDQSLYSCSMDNGAQYSESLAQLRARTIEQCLAAQQRTGKHLSQDGIIIVVATLDAETGDVVSGPDVVSRGFVYVKENEDLMNKARDLACHVIYDYYDVKGRDWNTVKSKLRDEISHLMYEKTKRSPMVLPILMEI